MRIGVFCKKASVVFLVIVLVVSFSACSRPEIEYGQRMSALVSSGEYSYVMMHADWPYYENVDEAVSASDYIFSGKVKEISFDILDMKSGLSDDAPISKSTSRMLYTIYEIEIVTVHKGEVGGTVKIAFPGGIVGYEEEIQMKTLVDSNLASAYSGIPVLLDGNNALVEGAQYMFFTARMSEQHMGVINMEQYAMSSECSWAKTAIEKVSAEVQ